MRKIIKKALAGVLAAIFLFSSFKVVQYLVVSNQEKNVVDSVYKQITTDILGDTQLEPSLDSPLSDVDIEKLYKLNKDSVGWLRIPNTIIDYPVMHTPNDNEKYLHKDFYEKKNKSGLPFLDGLQTLDNDNIFIYGHNMKNGTMFWSLKKYKNKAYFNNNSTIYFKTVLGVATYEVYAVVDTNSKSEWYNYRGQIDEDTFNKMMQYIDKKAVIKSDAAVNFGDEFLTLSTCGANGDKRLLVIAVKK